VNAWDRVWQALRLPHSSPAAPTAADSDDAFDFLAPDPACGPALAGNALDRLSDPDSPRGREVHDAARWLGDAAAELAARWQDLHHEFALTGIDADGAWLLCCLLARSQGVHCTGRDAVSDFLNRALASPAENLARAALEAALQVQASEVQLAVAERLARDPRALGHDGVDRFLTFLELHGDGRVVRTLEALLLHHGAVLSEAHAWRARHIVQWIRRGGRK